MKLFNRAIWTLTISSALLLTSGCTTAEPELTLPAPTVTTQTPEPNIPEESPTEAETEKPTAEEPEQDPQQKEDLDGSEPVSTDLTFTKQTDDIAIAENITYTNAETSNGSVPLTLDLYAPLSSTGEPELEGKPAVLLIHGGGFILGNKDLPNMRTWATELAQNGYVVANINYRLIPAGPAVTNPALIQYLASADPTSALPAQAPPESLAAIRIGLGAAVEDANAALTWLSEQGVDTNNIALAGESAGAITALHLTYLNSTLKLNPVQPAAVINLYGAFSIPGTSLSEIDAGEPPLWTIHGTNDLVVPYTAAEYLDKETSKAGIPHTLHAIEGAGHGFTAIGFFLGKTPDGISYLQDSINFLNSYLQ